MINHKQITIDVTYPTHKGDVLVLVGYFPMPYIHLYFYVMGNSGQNKANLRDLIAGTGLVILLKLD